VLADNSLKHGPVEVLLTIDEETGMTGAFELKPGLLQGDVLLNLDSEDEGELYIGCAGGMNTSASLKYKDSEVPSGMKAYRLAVKGLKGGHSGLDINLGRGNANKLLFRFLWHAERELGLRLASVDGGSLRNAIPREAFAEVVVPSGKSADFLAAVKDFEQSFIRELSETEPNLSFTAGESDMPSSLIDEATQSRLVKMVYGIPNGVIRMSADMPGIVETSTNLAIVKSDNGEIQALCLIRSSVDSAKFDLGNMTEAVMTLAGAEVTHDGIYPGWKPNINSPILNTMKNVYKTKYNVEAEIKVIHAGLECGIIGDTYPGLDLISFGPTIRFPHSPDEKVNIKSVGKFWDYLVDTLVNIPKK
ncbi:MAG TPA: beta-Ala-His dipeptidase, partial [Bacteroidales bacterium]|nr:beta-Ala-His dipeptidase [Bacteroidales bacterium]